MCEITPLVRAFILDHKIFGVKICNLGPDFFSLQRGFGSKLEIVVDRNFNYVIFLLQEELGEDLFDATEYLKEFLGIAPTLVQQERI